MFPCGRGQWYQGKEMLACARTTRGARGRKRPWPSMLRSRTTVLCPSSARLEAHLRLRHAGDSRHGRRPQAGIARERADRIPLLRRRRAHVVAVQLIKPINDPGFRGMSCVRMCETNPGTWLIGSHDGVWTVPPTPPSCRHAAIRPAQRRPRQVVDALAWARPNGWFVKEFDRMDEGTVLAFPAARR